VASLIVPSRRSFSSRTQALCPLCAQRAQERVLVGNWWLGLAGALMWAVLIWRRMGQQDTWEAPAHFAIAWGFAGSFWMMPPLIILHELAHAVVGWMVRLRVFGITIGRGRLLRRGRVGCWFMEWRLWPTMGLCWVLPRKAEGARWRMALMVAAGPASHLLLCVIAWMHLRDTWPVEGFHDIRHGLWCALLAANGMLLVMNLVPFEFTWNQVKVGNDGRQLWELLRGRTAATASAWHFQEAEMCLQANRLDEAERWVAKGLAAPPVQVYLVVQWVRILGARGLWLEAGQVARRYLPAKDIAAEVTLKAWAAVADVYAGVSLTEADAFSRRCLEVTPWDGAVQMVHAAVLMGQGKTEQAGEVLRASPPLERGSSADMAACWLWVEYCRRCGDGAGEGRWRKRGRRVDPLERYRVPQPAAEDRTLWAVLHV
jgi:hypothetical protein